MEDPTYHPDMDRNYAPMPPAPKVPTFNRLVVVVGIFGLVLGAMLGFAVGQQSTKESCQWALLTVEDHWGVVQMLNTGEITPDRYVQLAAEMYHQFDSDAAECR